MPHGGGRRGATWAMIFDATIPNAGVNKRTFALAPLLLLLACATYSQKARTEVASLENEYTAAVADYKTGCSVVPNRRQDCQAYYDALRRAYKAARGAEAALKAGRADAQMKELRDAIVVLGRF